MESRRIVILTGAGISKESGLDTFRDPDGLWARVRIEDVATPAAFARDPDRVHAFYNHRREALVAEHVAPNAAHLALARLRSEEHTSELQSLMRISYAVFCLKKKNKKQKNTTNAFTTQ